MRFYNFEWVKNMVSAFLTPEFKTIIVGLSVKGSKTGVKRVKNLNLTPSKTLAGGVKNRGSKSIPLYGDTF